MSLHKDYNIPKIYFFSFYWVRRYYYILYFRQNLLVKFYV